MQKIIIKETTISQPEKIVIIKSVELENDKKLCLLMVNDFITPAVQYNNKYIVLIQDKDEYYFEFLDTLPKEIDSEDVYQIKTLTSPITFVEKDK